MTTNDASRLALLLRRLCAAYGRPFSPELLEAHALVLADEAIEAVELRGITWLATQRWFPAPVDLLHGARRDAKQRAEAAWVQFRASIRSGGAVDDALGNRVWGEMGGTHRLGQLEAFALDQRRSDFVARYVALADEEAAEFASSLAARLGHHRPSLVAGAAIAGQVAPSVDPRIAMPPRPAQEPSRRAESLQTR